MVYSVSYNKSDFQPIIIDGLGTVGASFVGWTDLIILLLVVGFILAIFFKLGKLF